MPRSEAPSFLTVEEVTRLNAEVIRRYGGTFGVLKPDYLESAVFTPQQRAFGQWLHPTLAAQAGAYLFHISRNHPFEDGNKRTALLACETFLAMNGKELTLNNSEKESLTRKVAAGELTKDALLEEISMRTRSLEGRQISKTVAETSDLQDARQRPTRLLVEVERDKDGKVYRVITGLEEGQRFKDVLAPGQLRSEAIIDPDAGRRACFTSKTMEHGDVLRALERDPTLDRDLAEAKRGRAQPVELSQEARQDVDQASTTATAARDAEARAREIAEAKAKELQEQRAAEQTHSQRR